MQQVDDPQVERRLNLSEPHKLVLGIAVAAIILFVGIGGSLIPHVVRSLAGIEIAPSKALSIALFLNIALIIIVWSRYRELLKEFSVLARERRDAEERARILAETDPLTGCLNRSGICNAIDNLIAESAARNEFVAILMVDLDNFKQINDCNGHDVGDLVLQETARRITTLLPDRSLMARLGGDEFACLVPFAAENTKQIDWLAAEIIESVTRPIMANRSLVQTTVSLGIVRSDVERPKDQGPTDAQMLLRMADIAMHYAKKQGRSLYYWFAGQMADELRFRSEIEASIRRAIPAGEFIPFYEQQVDLDSGELVGFEVLARWNSPILGVVSPDIFIPIAEELGLIADLSESVIARALRDARTWSPELTLAVNISPVQLRDPAFAQRLLKLLVEANFPPHRLEVEITESYLHENVGLVRTLITSLKNQGIRINLDDFGTGYSSLSQLRTLPFDGIKIDRSFISSLLDNEDSERILRAITLLGKELGMSITVEGIETEAMRTKLRGFGKFRGQGYLYGRPEPVEGTHDWTEGAKPRNRSEASPRPAAADKRRTSGAKSA
jgi:diguanylate cyclase (GGDEF)-like protein